MISLIKMEFYKLWMKKSFLIFLCSLCILNICLLAFSQNSNASQSPHAYQKFQETIEALPNDERYVFVENYYQRIKAYELIQQVYQLNENQLANQNMIDEIYSNNPQIKDYELDYQYHPNYLFTSYLETESLFIEDIYQEMTTLYHYPKYIQNILNKAEQISQISIFQKADSSQKNLIKSAQDYQACLSIPITYESEKGVHDALSFQIASYLIVFALIIISLYMVLEEKEKNLLSFIHATRNGQSQTIFAKMIVMCLSIGVIVSIMTVTQLLYMSFTCGLGDLTRSLQSLRSYQQCPFQLQIYQYIIIYILIKWVVSCLVGLLILWISLLVKNRITCLLIVGIFFLFEFVCFQFIGSLDTLYLLKYFNLLTLLQTDYLFQIYRNIEFFSQLFSIQVLMIIFCFIFFIIHIIIIVLTYQNNNMSIKQNHSLHFVKRKKVSLTLYKQEWYKILWTQKVIFIFLFCLGLQYYQYSHIDIYQSPEQYTYYEYMKVLEGPLTDKKVKYIETKKQEFEDLHAQLDQVYQKQELHELTQEQARHIIDQLDYRLQNEDVFEDIYQDYENILNNPQLDFVIPFAYEELFLSSSWSLTPSIILIVFIIISISQIYTFEYQNHMNKVINTTPLGIAQLKRKKFIISICIMSGFFVMIYLPTFLLIQKNYGFSSLSSLIQSISKFNQFSIPIPLGLALVFLYLIRFIIMVAIVCVLHQIALKTRSHLLSVVISMIVFVVPLILIYGGTHLLEGMSLYPGIMNIQFLMSNKQQLYVWSYLLLSISIILYSLKEFSFYKKIFLKMKKQ